MKEKCWLKISLKLSHHFVLLGWKEMTCTLTFNFFQKYCDIVKHLLQNCQFCWKQKANIYWSRVLCFPNNLHRWGFSFLPNSFKTYRSPWVTAHHPLPAPVRPTPKGPTPNHCKMWAVLGGPAILQVFVRIVRPHRWILRN